MTRTALTLSLASMTLLTSGLALAVNGPAPASQRYAMDPLEEIMVLEVDEIAPENLLERYQPQPAQPLRFAEPSIVGATPQTHGTWESLGNGSKVWRLRISAPGSTDLNFAFSRFKLPAGALLHILSVESGDYQGPWGVEHNKAHGELWTPAVAGDHAVIELSVPAGAAFEPELELSSVNRGFRDLFDLERAEKTRQGSCNNDVICPEWDDWRDQIRSVARITISGAFLCTGSLVMDAERSFTPYFLTAFHCGVTENTDQSMVAYWNYESSICGNLNGGSLSQNQSGSTFVAGRENNDFTLVRLDETPDESFDVYYNGFDASGAIPQQSVSIHHPSGDEKAISFNDDAVTRANSCIGSGNQTHWRVDSWEDGTTEGGSSGCPLYDADSGLVVGYLSGGAAACGNSSFDCFGAFDVGWDGSSATQNLGDWLDPNNTGTLVVQGANPGDVGPPATLDYLIGGMARVNGAGTSVWRSKVTLLNRSGGTATVTMSFVAASGTTTASVTLADGEMRSWDDVASDLFGLSNASGAIKVETDRELIVTARTYNLAADGTFGQYLPGISTETLAQGQIGLLSQLSDVGFRSNVGFINLSDSLCRIETQLFDSSSTAIGNPLSRNLQPYAWTQINDIFAKAGASAQANAYAEVYVRTSGCQAWAYGSVVDQGTDDPTTSPLIILP